MPKQMPEAYYTLLEQIQAADFVLVELNLYLDTHPGDLDAIKQYNHFSQQSQALKAQFEQQFGPLQHFGQSMSRAPFEWPEAPWPWQV